MIADSLANWKAMGFPLSPGLVQGLEWLEENKDTDYDDGEIPLDNGLLVKVQSYDTKDTKGGQFENHHQKIDIQYIVDGTEAIYWSKPGSMKRVKPFDNAKDIEFFEPMAKNFEQVTTCIILQKGQFAIFFPSDWHLPSMTPSKQQPAHVKKFVIKVPVPEE
jgi:YhcH/YjgK/YiaL family protein